MDRRNFIKGVSASIASLHAGNAIADLDAVEAVPSESADNRLSTPDEIAREELKMLRDKMESAPYIRVREPVKYVVAES